MEGGEWEVVGWMWGLEVGDEVGGMRVGGGLQKEK